MPMRHPKTDLTVSVVLASYPQYIYVEYGDKVIYDDTKDVNDCIYSVDEYASYPVYGYIITPVENHHYSIKLFSGK